MTKIISRVEDSLTIVDIIFVLEGKSYKMDHKSHFSANDVLVIVEAKGTKWITVIQIRKIGLKGNYCKLYLESVKPEFGITIM